MPRKRNPVPSYRRLRRKGKGDLAFVDIKGRRRYLGAFDSDESRAAYARIIAEHQAGCPDQPAESSGTSIGDLVAGFWEHADRHYRKPSGGVTSELDCYRQATRPLVEIYGDTPASSFGPRALKAVRQRMIDIGWSRPYINAQVGRIKRIIKWSVAEELIPPSILHGLQAVAGLQAGRSKAPEPKPITPVDDAIVDVTLPHLLPTVRAMATIQRLTGMRPGEVCAMRTCDIDVRGRTWTYTPHEHKTAWRGKARRVLIGPKAAKALKSWLKSDLQAFIFTPAQSAQEWLERRRSERKTNAEYGNQPGANRVRNPQRKPGDRFTVSAYGHAIAYACRRAWPTPDDIKDNPKAVAAWHRDHKWTPNQLRHSYATRVRREHGVDVAGTLLGHAPGSSITAVYAERAESLAREVAQKIG